MAYRLMPYKWQLALGAGVAVFLTIVMAWRHVMAVRRRQRHEDAAVAVRLATEKPDAELAGSRVQTETARAVAAASERELAELADRLKAKREAMTPETSRESARKAGT